MRHRRLYALQIAVVTTLEETSRIERRSYYNQGPLVDGARGHVLQYLRGPSQAPGCLEGLEGSSIEG